MRTEEYYVGEPLFRGEEGMEAHAKGAEGAKGRGLGTGDPFMVNRPGLFDSQLVRHAGKASCQPDESIIRTDPFTTRFRVALPRYVPPAMGLHYLLTPVRSRC